MSVAEWRRVVDGLLAHPGPLMPGNKGPDVERLQGLLALAGTSPGPLDGDFGPRTAEALDDWRARVRGAQPGPLSHAQWILLTSSLREAFAPLDLERTGLERKPAYFGNAVALVARQHLTQYPRELPSNRGPWVRAYCQYFANMVRWPGGGEGNPWCAAAVSSWLYQAAEAVGMAKPPISGSLSCDALATQARAVDKYKPLLWLSDGRHLYNVGGMKPNYHIHPGDIFLVRGRNFNQKKPDWVHTGVVTRVLPSGWSGEVNGKRYTLPAGGVSTVEGNTLGPWGNEAGTREGVEVAELVRPWSELDFICWRLA